MNMISLAFVPIRFSENRVSGGARKNQEVTLFTATEIYTPVMCSVKLQVEHDVHKRMDEFVACAGLWIACTPSF